MQVHSESSPGVPEGEPNLHGALDSCAAVVAGSPPDIPRETVSIQQNTSIDVIQTIRAQSLAELPNIENSEKMPSLCIGVGEAPQGMKMASEPKSEHCYKEEEKKMSEEQVVKRESRKRKKEILISEGPTRRSPRFHQDKK